MRVVGIGTSAGGLDALERVFSHVAVMKDWAWIVVQHLSPTHKSLMADILGKRTPLRVAEAVDGAPIEGGCIHLVPPHANLMVSGMKLRLIERAAAHTLNLPVDVLFRSMAEEYGPKAIGVVLSGTGSDGRAGLAAIKQAGGLVVVQEPTTARFDGMPLAAVSTGVVDAVVPAEEIGQELLRLTDTTPAPALVPPDTMEQLHARLLHSTGIDFREYKPTTVLRRVEYRKQKLGVADLEEYLRRLEADPEEVRRLGDELLINVTRFFRDGPAWELLRQRVVPALERLPLDGPLRAWVPACASGQEAYSLGMLLTELLPPERDFKIFATDVDATALQVATAGSYDDAEMEGVTPDARRRFFNHANGRWVVDRSLRHHIVFAHHNIARHPPFTRLDLVTCRNLLIYLALPLQQRVLGSLAFSLKVDGFLMLGPSETLGEMADRFRTVDGQWKLYQRTGGARVTPPHGTLPQRPLLAAAQSQPSAQQSAVGAAFRLLVDRVAPASVLVTEQLELVSVFGNTGGLLRVSTGDASLHLLPMLPEALRTLATLAVNRALQSREDALLAVAAAADLGVTQLRGIPVSVPGTEQRFVLLVFEHQVGVQPAETVSVNEQKHVAELHKELAFVRESLQATVEALETSNEELQATNEELLAANEELQGTNEELQSVNEELNTVNAEHQVRIAELTQANEDLDNLFRSTMAGTLFLDDKLHIRRFTEPVTQVMDILPRDVGRPVQHLASSLEDPEFLPDLQAVVQGGVTVEREVTHARGRFFLRRMSPYLNVAGAVRGVVVGFVDVTPLRLSRQTAESLQVLIDSLPQHLAVISSDGTIRAVNAAWSRFSTDNGGPPEASSGKNYLDACASTPGVRSALEAVLAGTRADYTMEYPCAGREGQRWFVTHAARLADGNGAVVSHTEVTRWRTDRGGAP